MSWYYKDLNSFWFLWELGVPTHCTHKSHSAHNGLLHSPFNACMILYLWKCKKLYYQSVKIIVRLCYSSRLSLLCYAITYSISSIALVRHTNQRHMHSHTYSWPWHAKCSEMFALIWLPWFTWCSKFFHLLFSSDKSIIYTQQYIYSMWQKHPFARKVNQNYPRTASHIFFIIGIHSCFASTQK